MKLSMSGKRVLRRLIACILVFIMLFGYVPEIHNNHEYAGARINNPFIEEVYAAIDPIGSLTIPNQNYLSISAEND